MATITSRSGQVFVVPDAVEADYLKQGFIRPGGSAPRPYRDMKVPELRALIAERNEGRDEDALIPAEGKKPDLVAALNNDDDLEV